MDGLDGITGLQGPDWRGSYGQAQLTNWIPMMWIGSGDELRLFVDGILVAKASGIAHSEAGIAYPASNQLTVAVGASTDFDLRSDYSQFGPHLDFVAPSSGGSRGICTTDRTGAYGDDPGDYTNDFGGTSAATPLASGVAALMLSRNPNLTGPQVRTILRQTCQKIGDQPYTDGRNDQYGFGRIDAEAAVLAAGTGP